MQIHEEWCRGLVYVLLVDPDTFDCMANPQPGLQAPWETGEDLTIEPLVVKLKLEDEMDPFLDRQEHWVAIDGWYYPVGW